MSDPQTSVARLDVDIVARRCAEESRNFFKGAPSDDRFCYDLFRRAIVTRNSHAWEIIFQQYRNLVSGWIRRSSAFDQNQADIEELINATFTKFWRSLDAAKFARFETLQALLRYLQMCAGSAVTDRLRRHRYEQFLDPLDAHRGQPESQPAESGSLIDVERTRFWTKINALLNDKQEEVLVHSYFVLGLKPRQILDHFGDHFTSIEDVYRVKRNVMSRLRRAPELADLWDS